MSVQTTAQTPLSAVLYSNSRVLHPNDGHMRIFAPISYATVRRAQLVPLVHSEAFTVASWFPICWQIKADQPVLVALRTLKADGSSQPAGSPGFPASLPLALRAYPFVVGLNKPIEDPQHVLIDDTIPDEPSNVGAPILTPDGSFGSGATLKLNAVTAFNEALAFTQILGEELALQNLLEPWPLHFQIGQASISVGDLFIVRQSEFGGLALYRFIKNLGVEAASLLGAHRLSLFRAGALLQAAKAIRSHTPNGVSP